MSSSRDDTSFFFFCNYDGGKRCDKKDDLLETSALVCTQLYKNQKLLKGKV